MLINKKSLNTENIFKNIIRFFNSLILKDKNHYGYILESGQLEPQIVKEMIDLKKLLLYVLDLVI